MIYIIRVIQVIGILEFGTKANFRTQILFFPDLCLPPLEYKLHESKDLPLWLIRCLEYSK